MQLSEIKKLFNTLDISQLPQPNYWMNQKIIDIHMQKHHQGYINKLLPLIENENNLNTTYHKLSLNQIISTAYQQQLLYMNEISQKSQQNLKNLSHIDIIKLSENNIHMKILNNAAQIWNHNVFWLSMKNNTKPSKKTLDLIIKNFGSLDNFYTTFINKGLAQFGSGWLWLILHKNKLIIETTSNAYTPITNQNKIVILTCDLWEHSYYLEYTFDRKKYITEFIQYINWDLINANLDNL